MYQGPTCDQVARLLHRQCRSLGGHQVIPVASQGTQHFAFRVGDRLVARFPRDEDAAAGLGKEAAWLPRLARQLPLSVPDVEHLGHPDLGWPSSWLLTTWIDGADASCAVLAGEQHPSWASTLADVVGALRAVDLGALPRVDWPTGSRGGPLAERADALPGTVDALAGPLDPTSITRLVGCALAAEAPSASPVLLHADLIPGNLVVRGDRLVGLIDLGCLTTGAAAWDLTPAWWVLNGPDRARFRAALAVDEASWRWGRALSAIQALLATWFYTPRHHPLGRLGSRALAEAVAVDAADSPA